MSKQTGCLLTINLEGAKVIRNLEETSEKVTINLPQKSLFDNNVSYPQQKETVEIYHKGIHTIPAIKKVNLSSTQIKYFLITPTKPFIRKFKDWNRLPDKTKLELHFIELCQHYNGFSFSYELVD